MKNHEKALLLQCYRDCYCLKNKVSIRMVKLRHILMLSLLVGLTTITTTAQPPTNSGIKYTLRYTENFSGTTLNTNDWYYREEEGLVGGGYNRRSNVSVENGYLRIDYTNRDVNGDGIIDRVGGGIVSKKAFNYGYYEAKMKFYDATKGFHQSFWTVGAAANSAERMADRNADLVPFNNSMLEIDGVELDSDHNSGGANFYWHRKTPIRNAPGAPGKFSSSYTNTNEWIIYGFEWRPNLVIYYVNGVERHRFHYPGDSRHSPQEVLLTGLANNIDHFGGGGIPQPGAHFKVDWFKYYSYPVKANLVGNHDFESQKGKSEVPEGWIFSDGVKNNLYSDGTELLWDNGAKEGLP